MGQHVPRQRRVVHGRKAGVAGRIQPDVSRLSRALHAHDRARRHAHQRRAWLCDDAFARAGREAPTAAAVAFDVGKHTFRTDLYDGYKANRKPMPEELRQQDPVIRDLLARMGCASSNARASRPTTYWARSPASVRSAAWKPCSSPATAIPSSSPATTPPYCTQSAALPRRSASPPRGRGDLWRFPRAADRRQGPDGRHIGQHPRRARRGRKDSPAPHRPVRRPRACARRRGRGGEGPPARAPFGKRRSRALKPHAGDHPPRCSRIARSGKLAAERPWRRHRPPARTGHEPGAAPPCADGEGAGERARPRSAIERFRRLRQRGGDAGKRALPSPRASRRWPPRRSASAFILERNFPPPRTRRACACRWAAISSIPALARAEALEAARPLLACKAPKALYNVKALGEALPETGDDAFDTMLAAYVLDPQRPSFDLRALCEGAGVSWDEACPAASLWPLRLWQEEKIGGG